MAICTGVSVARASARLSPFTIDFVPGARTYCLRASRSFIIETFILGSFRLTIGLSRFYYNSVVGIAQPLMLGGVPGVVCYRQRRAHRRDPDFQIANGLRVLATLVGALGHFAGCPEHECRRGDPRDLNLVLRIELQCIEQVNCLVPQHRVAADDRGATIPVKDDLRIVVHDLTPCLNAAIRSNWPPSNWNISRVRLNDSCAVNS